MSNQELINAHCENADAIMEAERMGLTGIVFFLRVEREALNAILADIL